MELDVQNENKSPRLTKLGDILIDWIKSYPKEEFINVKEGIELIVLGVDNKYKDRLCFMLGDKINTIDSAFNATNHGIGDFLKNKNKDTLESDIFTGIANYIAYVCIDNKDIWNNFKTFVEKNIQEQNAKNNKITDEQCESLANAVKDIVKKNKNKRSNK